LQKYSKFLKLFSKIFNRPFGEINSIKIWHDNSGRTPNEASWYLRHVIIHDLQTRDYFYFICGQWLALNKGDGCIERNLMVASESDKTKFSYLLSKETKKKLTDDHLWFSIFARPVQSSFTRLDRLTCCFVLLAISMLMNILYYGMGTNQTSQSGLKIGPYFNFTPEQIGIGFVSSIFIFFPSFFLVQLFRHIKRRKSTRMEKLKTLLNIKEEKSESKRKERKKINIKQFRFPWWFKFIAYAISFLFAGVSLFFVIIKGIEFGNEKVAKWLTSLFVSFISSVFLTQPLLVRMKNRKI
jgi:hypothetical protein